MGRALVVPVQGRRRSGELKSPGSRDPTPTAAFGQRESCEAGCREKPRWGVHPVTVP
jgi:hypothetical protein